MTPKFARVIIKNMSGIKTIVVSQKKKDLISKINWDYDISEDEALKIIENKKNKSPFRINYFVKSLERFSWQDLVFLWGLESVTDYTHQKSVE